MKAEDMYRGFSKEQAEAYEQEAKEKWGPAIVEESKQRVMKMGKEGLEALKKEGEFISKELAELTHLDPSDKRVQSLVHRHYNMTNRFTRSLLKYTRDSQTCMYTMSGLNKTTRNTRKGSRNS